MNQFELIPYNVVDTIQVKNTEVWDWANEYSNAKVYHSLGFEGQGVINYVIDTMAATDHPDILPNLLVDKCKDFHGDGGVNGHGQWCASKIASPRNNKGVIGIAPKSKIVGLKAMSQSGVGFSTNLVKAIKYAADDVLPNGYKAKVINMSLGSTSPMEDVRQAMEYAVSKGCIIVCAAGNNNGSMTYPARYTNLCVAVGSHSENEQKSWFSNVGEELDFTAGGENVYGAYKDGYATLQGTSMSTPLVAGVISLEQSRRIKKGVEPMNLEQTEEFLKGQVKDLGQAGKDIVFGHGAIKINNELPELDTPVDEEPVEPTEFVNFTCSFDVADYNKRKCYKLKVTTKEGVFGNSFYNILSNQYFNILSSYFLYQSTNETYVEYLEKVKEKLLSLGKIVIEVTLITDLHELSIN